MVSVRGLLMVMMAVLVAFVFSMIATDVLLYLMIMSGEDFTFQELIRVHAMGVVIGFMIMLGVFVLAWIARVATRKTPDEYV